ncbi:LysM peptidoglycan-binding domain-containing protein [Chryseobacterium sp.]|uniref:LysM peptidoglycan-binding domain-containing protein n=1 Tax=Chryseobacterium sp. TaxID=1871047 RepID=UPI0011CA760C|nr:LysM peptidoglycan-binding domain-containing protein [Chryseobacterium sp.]TXF76233.1 LysM peptidoglycan-binding domain-containing protein [Chryseobacterium sp.]
MIKRVFILSALFACISIFAQKKHTVVKGDNPYSIAKKYGMSVDELLKMNPAAKDGILDIGEILTVKGSAKVAAVPSNSGETGTIILKPKQTIYGITKQYHITESELRRLNPNLDAGMQIGNEIVLPLANIKKYGENLPVTATNTQAKQVIETTVSDKVSAPVTASADDYVTYTVEDGDTVFSIVNKFGITIDDLIALNPGLSGGLRTGMVLKIKKMDAGYVKKNSNALKVVMMLPFGFDSNDSNYRSMALDFLTGAKLAIERNAMKGQLLDIQVVDAGNEASFKNSLTQINKDNTDLIIGPFFKSSILEVLDFLGNTKIPVVAPFANSTDLYAHSNLIIIETNEQAYLDRISEEVKSVYSNQKIYIVADANKTGANYLKTTLEKAVRNPNIIIVTSPADIQLEQNMMTGQSAPVIAVLVNDNDTVGENFASRIIALSKETPGMKAFSSVYVPVFEKKFDELSEANLVYLMDRKINTEGAFEQEILAAYKSKYCKTPTKYAVIGFDVMNDMLSRENKKGEIFKQMNKVQTQLATKFEFVKTKPGAYINTGYRVVRLVP